MSDAHEVSRRQFLKIIGAASGALIVGLQLPAAADTPDPLLGQVVLRLNPYVRIEPDGTIVIGARDPEVGQGIRTAEARIIAEELDADWPRVLVLPMPLGAENGIDEPHWTLGHQEARGSTGVPAAWSDLRTVGATARNLLIRAAAQRWNLDASRLRTQLSTVIAPDGRKLGYGELANAASVLPAPPSKPALKSPAVYHLIGEDAGDVDARDIVTGAQRYAGDQWFADALVAVIARCPFPGGWLRSLDDTDASAMAGVEKIVRLPKPDPTLPLGTRPLRAGVAVLAADTWTALRARAALIIQWHPGAHAAVGDRGLAAQLDARLQNPPDTSVRNDGDVDHARKLAHRTLSARYEIATVAHAELEPPNCLVRLSDDRAQIVAPLQNPRGALAVVQRLTGLPSARIDISLPRSGGGFGRRLDNDHVAEAVLIAQAAKKPVKLLWTQTDAFAHDCYRPFAVHELEAGLDRANTITAWRQYVASTSRLAGRGEPHDRLWLSEVHPDDLPAGLIDNLQLDWFALDSALPRGNWRAGSHGVNAFAVQGFLDEIAQATKQDGLQMRLNLLGAPRQLPYRGHGGPVLDTGRLAYVLKLAADAIGWTKKHNDGHGLGLAFHFTYGGYVAHALEVSVTGGKLVMHNAVVAADLGRVINPLGARAALVGATLDGLSTALDLSITIKDGRIEQTGFSDYPLATMGQLPHDVQVILVPSQATPTGAYEMGLPSAAPALANAIFAATTVRVRKLPILRELMRLL